MRLFRCVAIFLFLQCVTGCSINLASNSPTNPPYIVDSSNQIIQPILTDPGRVMNLPTGKAVTVACPGPGNTLTATGQQSSNASCVSDTTLKLDNNKQVAFSKLGCSSGVKETVKENGTCHQKATRVEIGWQMNDNKFIQQITVCHDKATANTLYSIDQIVGASITATDTTNPRPTFRKGNFFSGIQIDNAYSQAAQAVTLTRIFGAKLAAQYLSVSKSFYFARGHFSPDGDFIDAASQDATYYYINVAPQWQSFNNGNWKALESATRRLASSRARTLTTYTGGYGVLNLPDSKGVEQPIYLALDKENKQVVPVPKYYWKVVHDPESNKAAAFVGINNPHLTTVEAEDIFCKDVCKDVTWAKLNSRLSITAGYTFCCSVADLKKTIPYAPDLGNLALLV